jgi:hypothetical protein
VEISIVRRSRCTICRNGRLLTSTECKCLCSCRILWN